MKSGGDKAEGTANQNDFSNLQSIMLSQCSQVTPQSYEQGAARSQLNPKSDQIVPGGVSHPSAMQMMHIA